MHPDYPLSYKNLIIRIYIYLTNNCLIMKKCSFIFLIMTLIITATVDGQQRPTIFPGAVPQWEGNPDYYLTRGDYSEVISYYTKEKGAPRHREDHGEKGRSAWFLYVERLPDDGGLSVNEKRGNYRGAARVFSQLKPLVVQGHLSDERVNEIEQKYGYLQQCYFVYEKSERGKDTPYDEIIFNKHNKKLGVGGTEAVDMDEVMKKAQELMSAGKMEEGLALMTQAREDMISGMNTANSPKAVDLWIECLEEIAANAYPIRLSISM